MAFKIETASHVQTRVATLKRRAEYSRAIMRKLDLWRNMLKEQLEHDIWHDVPVNSRRWTTMSDYPSAVIDAAIAMLSTDRPQVTAIPKRSYSVASQDAATAIENIGAAIFDTLNLHRTTTIETQVADYALSRANLIVKLTSLGPEERGETRIPTQPMLEPLPFGESQDEYATPFEIQEDGTFPVLFQLLDALDCYWTLGKDDRVIEFAHCYSATWDVLCDEFPDLYEHEKFKKQAESIDYADTPVEVIDYWHEERDGIFNTILIASEFFKKPTKTDLPFMPIVVEEVNAREVPVSGEDNRRQRLGRMFAEYIIDYAAEVSWCMSLGRSYIEMMPFATLFLTGVDTSDPRNFLMSRRDADGEPVFQFVMDNSPGGKAIPLPPGVELEYPPVPELVPILQEMKAYYSQSMQNLTLPQAVLSGDVQGPPSGYAYFQMKQVPLARLGPYEIGANRFLSRALEMVNRIIVYDWDRMDAPLVLQQLTGQTNENMSELPVTREQFAAVGSIQVRMKVTLPSNKEQEDTAIIQKNQTGLLSATTSIDLMADVQDAKAEWEQAMAQTWIAMNPDAQARIASAWMDKNNYPGLQPRQQMAPPDASMMPPTAPGGLAPQAGPPGMAPMPAGPVPGMPPGGNGMQEQLPPELLAMLAQGGPPR